MITNLIATVIVSVVTNWVDVYEPTLLWSRSVEPLLTPSTYYYATNTPCVSTTWRPENFDNKTKCKLSGKVGMVYRVTEIKFEYDGKPQTYRIEEPLEKITFRCREKKPEFIWDEPIREKLK